MRRLAVGYYENWRPSRAEVALLVDFEMGRITEAEYLAAAPRPAAVEPATDALWVPDPQPGPEPRCGTVDDARAGHTRESSTGRSGTGRAPGKPTRIAAFTTDCGDVAPPFRLVVRGLTTNGWTVRGGRRYRLMTLHYVLLPPTGSAARNGGSKVTPVLYTAAITCVADVVVPLADSDGRHRQHSVGSGHIVGSRGPWPVADNARAVEFLFSRQHPVGTAPATHPAGILRVDLRQSSATWRPVAGQPAATASG